MWNGGDGREDAIEAQLRALDADVVALEEANSRESCERWASALGYELVWGEANSEFAVAWLSRLPIVRFANHRLPVLAKTLLELRVGELQLLATHLVHGNDVDRRVEEVDAILEHVQPPTILVGDFNAVREDEGVGEPVPRDELKPLDRRSVERVVAAGFRDCYRALHTEHGWTYQSGHPFVRIDYVFAHGVEVTHCDVVESDASDHFALVAELS